MKSEHRHELKTNELERIASEFGHATEHFLHQYRNQLIVAVVAVVIAAVGLLFWRNAAGAGDRQGWRALADARSAADFATVADKYPGTKVAAWARLQEAEAELYSGVQMMFTNRDAGNSELKKSRENFDKLIADRSTPQDALERARFGLARCLEALPTDKTAPPSKINDPAIEAYERLLKEFPDTIYKPVAESRIAALRTATAQDFYAWFEVQNPKPADREMPKDLAVPPLPEGPVSSSTSSGQPAAPAAKDAKGEAPQKPVSKESAPSSSATKSNADSKTPQKPASKTSSGGPALPAPSSAPASK